MLTPDEMGVLIDFVFKYANKEAERIAENAQDSGTQDAKGGTANLSTSADGDQLTRGPSSSSSATAPRTPRAWRAGGRAPESTRSAVGSGANANASFYDQARAPPPRAPAPTPAPASTSGGGRPAASSGANADASFYDLSRGPPPPRALPPRRRQLLRPRAVAVGGAQATGDDDSILRI